MLRLLDCNSFSWHNRRSMRILLILFFLLSSLSIHAEPTTIVIFGANGDLAMRKLYPALYHLAQEGEEFEILGVGRRELTDRIFSEMVYHSVKPEDAAFWNSFKNRISYQKVDFFQEKDYAKLKIAKGNRLYYLSTPASAFSPILTGLSYNNLLSPFSEKSWTRVVIEKPFGRDINSARALYREITDQLDEDQIYLIDHYLGKPGVLALVDLRFKSRFFEPLWNYRFIDRVEILISEDIGVGTRGAFWEETGLIRDMFQNHMMQLLALTAMDIPEKQTPETLHQEKIRLLREVIPPTPKDLLLGQYGPGTVHGKQVPAYREEPGVAKNSPVETFASLRLFIDNGRWKGVPFYLTAGKRLDKQLAEINVYFKNPDNKFTLRIQPNPAVSLQLDKGIILNTSLPNAPEAYEKLIYDVLNGDKSQFVDPEEHFLAWKLFTSILEEWKNSSRSSFPNYPAGSRGPKDTCE